MKRITTSLLLALALAAATSTAASAATEPVAGVVTSLAASSDIYAPEDFPKVGLPCTDVVTELQGRSSFKGSIKYSYPGTEGGQCYSVHGQSAKVAVVCCGPA